MNIAMTMLSLKLKGLKSYEKHILTTLCIRADEKTLECWPSLPCLKVDTGLNEKTIQQGILSLIEKNYILRTGEMKGKTKRTPCYRIIFNTTVKGVITKSNTPVYPDNTPAKGGVKYPRIRYMEGYSLKDIEKDVFLSKKLTIEDKQQIGRYADKPAYTFPKELIEILEKL